MELKAKIMTKEDYDELIKKAEEDESIKFVHKSQILGKGTKISGTCDAQVGAQMMYHITKLDELIKDLPFAGIMDGKAIIISDQLTN